MSESPREEVTELVRLLAAHLAWQRELGAEGAPASAAVHSGTRPPIASEPAAAPADEPAAPPVRFEMPDFLRKRGGGSPGRAPAPFSSPAPRVVVAPVVPVASVAPSVAAAFVPPAASRAGDAEPENLAPDPAAVVRPLFGEDPPSTPRVEAVRGPALAGEARLAALRVINDQVEGCTRCGLHQGRTRTVFSRGSPFAKLAFVGEGPGRDEDLQGRPFVGAAGQLLDKIIAAMGLTEEEVYICNVVKCRPPNNRVPETPEMDACGPYLLAQLGHVRPDIVVALGKTSATYLLRTTSSMSRLRGRWHTWEGIPLLATWHPAYLLRTPEAKRETWDDMKLVLQRMGRPVPTRAQ